MSFNPRPDFFKQGLVSLDGEWKFEFDNKNIGLNEGWRTRTDFSKKIIVPYVYQCEKSGINVQDKCDTVWYSKIVEKKSLPKGERIFLNFGACDYQTDVFINGHKVGSHTGGYSHFKFEITPYILDSNLIVVRVYDPYERWQPRGKQHLGDKADRCWYGASTGIWQSVWLCAVGDIAIDKFFINTDTKRRNVTLEVVLDKYVKGLKLKLTAVFNNRKIEAEYTVQDRIAKYTLDLMEEDYVDEIHYWAPEWPNLYDLTLELKLEEMVIDKVESYFGMRNIEVRNGEFIFNNRVIYQRLILNQGYYDKSMLTPKSDEDIIEDIKAIKALGYNGVRMHQVIADPRFYYYADKLGLYVWGELPSAYGFNKQEIVNLTEDMTKFIERDYNHPSIICWVPLNESWGTRNIRYDNEQIDFAKGLYHYIKALDPTRLVSGNDGWEIACGDFVAVHSYAQGRKFDMLGEYERYEQSTVDWRLCLCDDESMDNRPIILSEFGGIAFAQSEGWGYGDCVKSEQEFLVKLEKLMRKVYDNKLFRGFCYTQLTDVSQEVNGHLSMDRKQKVDVDKIKALIEGRFGE